MGCYKPLTAYRPKGRLTENGKSVITFRIQDCYYDHYETIELPCGQCIGCRIERSRQWAIRCVHEASLWRYNCFVTLTFNDDALKDNPSQTLIKSDFQNFMKRLRKNHEGIEYTEKEDGKLHKPIRYFHCGEYGSKLERPHHHACLFNFTFPDKTLWTIRDGVKLYRSETLEKLWCHDGKPLGYCTIGDVTFQSAAYVARYVTKKITGDKARAHYARVDKETGEMLPILPEYNTMSRRPGIGKKWFDQYYEDVFPKDFITYNGKKFRPPAYYDKIYDTIAPDDFKIIKEKRLTNLQKFIKDNTPERRKVREEVQTRKCKLLVREIENENADVCR